MKVVSVTPFGAFSFCMALLICLVIGVWPNTTWSKSKVMPRLVVDTELEAAELGSTVNYVAFSSDSKLMLWGSGYTTVEIWDFETNRRFISDQSLKIFAVSPDGGRMVTADGTGKIAELLDVATGKKIRTLKSYATIVSAAGFSPDGKTVVLAGLQEIEKGCASDIDLLDIDMKWKKSVGSCNISVHAFAFSPNGRILAAAEHQDSRWNGSEGTILFDTKTGEKIHKLQGPMPEHEEISPGVLHVVNFSPDGKIIATGGAGNFIELWDSTTGTLKHVLTGHEGKVTSVVFSRDGQTLASSSEDTTIKLWSVKKGEHLATLKGHLHPVNIVAYSPDGTRLISAANDSIRIWDPASRQQLGLLASYFDGEWVVTDNSGKYDSSEGSLSTHVSWHDGSKVWQPEQMRAKYYRPGLLAQIMNIEKGRTNKVASQPQSQMRLRKQRIP